MLEIRNLTKTYKTKNNVITKALDNVSIKFPDTGMVFLLGKSGSGKSTLLNLCGGLDSADSGEIIIKGRSSKTFTNSDFDSYRNTYVGFVFQEYNILNEFSVEDNIALALELQGRPKDKNKIKKILQDVELEEFANRKPNTLSGGQKQRIAIARALVKEPEIIMADEPSGALDSNTGKQVLETLKKLSKNKLVIVVSHDQEFAEFYGDRIIELKDGKVIVDKTKTYSKICNVGNLTIIDSNTISIKQGQLLNEKDLKEINNFLMNSKNEIIISNQQNDLKKFKEVSKINDSNIKESFINTDESTIKNKEYSKEDAKFITSKLPWHHAFKIGVSSMHIKPIRLTFTISLSMVAFILLGIVSTMTFYNKGSVAIKNLSNLNEPYLMISKGYNSTYYIFDDSGIENIRSTTFSNDDVLSIQDEYDNETIPFFNFQKDYPLSHSYYKQNISYSNLPNYFDGSFYLNEIIGFAYVDGNNSLRKNIVAGHYPNNDNEIMISTYAYETFKQEGLSYAENRISINSYEDLIGQKVSFNVSTNKEFTISGIYDVLTEKLFDKKYNKIKNIKTNYEEIENLDLISLWEKEIENNIYTLILVNDTFYQNNLDNFIDLNLYSVIYSPYSYGYDNFDIEKSNNQDLTLSCEADYVTYKDYRDLYNLLGEKIDNNVKEDIFLSVPLMSTLIRNYFDSLGKENNLYQEFNESIDNRLSIFENGIDDNLKTLSKNERIEYYKDVYNFLNNNNLIAKIFNDYSMNLGIYYDEMEDKFNVAGFVFEDRPIFFLDKKFVNYISDNDSLDTKYQINYEGYINGIFIKDLSKFDISSIVNKSMKTNEDDSVLVINSYIIEAIDVLDELVNICWKIFLVLGIILALFSTLLLSNFISISIANKQKEIGILRAVGARGADVFKIFISESLVIVSICSFIYRKFIKL